MFSAWRKEKDGKSQQKQRQCGDGPAEGLLVAGVQGAMTEQEIFAVFCGHGCKGLLYLLRDVFTEAETCSLKLLLVSSPLPPSTLEMF